MRRIARVLGFVLGGLVLLVVLAVAGVWLNAQRLLTQRHDNPVPLVTVTVTPDRVARGEYLVTAFPGCAGCHSSNPGAERTVLDGNTMADLAPLAEVFAPNLTPGGRLRDWSDGEIIRAIREGVSRDGRALAIMPSAEYRHLSDDDVQAIVAYLRSQPPVSREGPPITLKPLGYALVGTGQIPLSNQPPVQNVTAPPRGPTAAYGDHLAEISGCKACHGPALDGQNIPPGPPPGPNLRVVHFWTEAQFIRAMREGIDPNGRQLSDEMPWRQYGRGTDDDLRALYVYLKSLPLE